MRKSYSITSQPAEEPVSSAELKLHAKIDTSADDAVVAYCISAARQHCEEYLARSFITTERELILDGFPSNVIELPYAKVTAVNSIQYLDSSGSLQTLSTDQYQVVTGEPGRIYLNGTIPPTGDYLATVTINYDCGYGTASAVPENIKLAILMLATHLYDNRSTSSVLTIKEIPIGVYRLLDLERWQH